MLGTQKSSHRFDMVIDKTLLVLEAMLDCNLHKCPHVSIDACLRLKTGMRCYCTVHNIACNLLIKLLSFANVLPFFHFLVLVFGVLQALTAVFSTLLGQRC